MGAPRIGPPQIGIVVLQPTAFCNINCSYCYLPDRNNKHVLAQSTVTRLFTELFASGWACPQVTVIWHAGEPLVVPPAFYREAFATIERLRPPSVQSLRQISRSMASHKASLLPAGRNGSSTTRRRQTRRWTQRAKTRTWAVTRGRSPTPEYSSLQATSAAARIGL
jgi:hypothetical protein